MKIVVIGAGAIGSLIGAYLAEGSNEVTLINRWAEHVETINEKGLTVVTGDEIKNIRLPALTSPASLKVQDLIIITVKSYHTAGALRNIQNLIGKNTRVLTLQNGLGNAEIIKDTLGDVQVLAGTIAHGATVLGPGKIKHAGKGETIFGTFDGFNCFEDIAAEFCRCGLETGTTDNVTGLLWGKVLINVGINALTAICGVNNGWLTETEGTLKLMKSLVDEGESVAKALNIVLPYENAFEKVVNVARATGANRSSMLQDMDRGRPTEIDYINGVVIREGERLGIPTPCNNIITVLVKALEEKNLNKL